MSCILADVKAQVKSAMRARDKQRLGALRLIQSEFKRVEVDERIEIDDARALIILDKMLKQRRDSLSQYEAANREDLAEVERYELAVISEFMPVPLSDDEIAQLISDAISQTGASSMQDMGKVMGLLKPKLQGRADMGQVSQKIKSSLTNS